MTPTNCLTSSDWIDIAKNASILALKLLDDDTGWSIATKAKKLALMQASRRCCVYSGDYKQFCKEYFK